jgi:hypothetical protein
MLSRPAARTLLYLEASIGVIDGKWRGRNLAEHKAGEVVEVTDPSVEALWQIA